MDIAVQGMIGLLAGLLGGLLGVGGSIIIIPSLILYLSATESRYGGQTQHLLQAAAMLCNFFVATPSVLAHHKAGAIMKPVVVKLIPAALVGIVAGVALSNSGMFACEKGVYLGMGLSLFLVYVVGYNLWWLFDKNNLSDGFDSDQTYSSFKVIGVGVVMGLVAGLLGIGGGALCVPAQQVILRIPLRQAIANSATTIMCVSLFGAVYKNATLAAHQIEILSSIQLAVTLIPTAILGSFIGGKLVHLLPRKVLRRVFIIFMAIVALKTFQKSRAAVQSRSVSQVEPCDYLERSKVNTSLFLSSQEVRAKVAVERVTMVMTSVKAPV